MSSQAEHVGAGRLGRRSKGEGKLRASAAEWKWQRLHVRGPHHRRQPVLPHTKPPCDEEVSPARVP